MLFQGEQSRSVAGDQVIRIRDLGEGEQEIIPAVGRPLYLRQSSNALCDFAARTAASASSIAAWIFFAETPTLRILTSATTRSSTRQRTASSTNREISPFFMPRWAR